MTDKIGDAKLAQKVIDAFAYDPEGLTREECEGLGITEDQSYFLSSSLSLDYGEQGGTVTERERKNLEEHGGFSKDFIDRIAGSDGNLALRERVKWLAEQVVSKETRGSSREEFIKALSSSAEVALPILVRALGDEDYDVHIYAPKGLGDLYSEAKPATHVLIEQLNKDRGQESRYLILKALRSISLEATEEVIDAMIAQVERPMNYAGSAMSVVPIVPDGSSSSSLVAGIHAQDNVAWEHIIKSIAAHILGKLGPEAEAAVPVLVSELNTALGGDIIGAATWALCNIDPEGAIDVLTEALRVFPTIKIEAGPGCFTPKGNFVPNVVFAMCGCGPKAVPILMSELKKEQWTSSVTENSHYQAIRALGIIGPEAMDAIPLLLSILKDHKNDSGIRGLAARAIGRIGENNPWYVTPVLVRALKEREKGVAEYAAEALGKFGPNAWDAIDALIAALKDDDAEKSLRENAIIALGEIGPLARRAIPAIRAAEKKGIYRYYRDIPEAIEKIRGKK